jgi:hypothetical protein
MNPTAVVIVFWGLIRPRGVGVNISRSELCFRLCPVFEHSGQGISKCCLCCVHSYCCVTHLPQFVVSSLCVCVNAIVWVVMLSSVKQKRLTKKLWSDRCATHLVALRSVQHREAHSTLAEDFSTRLLTPCTDCPSPHSRAAWLALSFLLVNDFTSFDRQCTCNVIARCVRVTVISVVKQ